MSTTNGRYDIVVVTGDIITATDKACFMQIQGEKVWLPSSQFKRQSIQDKYKPERWTMFIPRWLAEERGFDYQEEDDWTDEQEDE